MAPKSIKGLNFFLAMTDNSGKFADMDGLTQMFKYDDDGTYHTRFSTERKGINLLNAAAPGNMTMQMVTNLP